ncbi:MAG: HipA N-terminal domain-containing protein [Opitutaceae bacterium]|jgi:hypothetical protein
MSRVTVHYQGIKVGELAVARGGIFFEYAPEFIASGHELSPFQLPLGSGVKARDPAVPTMRLHGLFEDSLPDHWGRRVMMAWFRERGTPEHAVTPLMMLAYVGKRAMGVLDYAPELEVAAPGEIALPDLYESRKESRKRGTPVTYWLPTALRRHPRPHLRKTPDLFRPGASCMISGARLNAHPDGTKAFCATSGIPPPR